MALARIQTAIISELKQLNRLSLAQVEALKQSPDELSGEALEETLLRDYKISPFSLLLAKARAFRLKPFNAANFIPGDKAFAQLDKEFCAQNNVLPIGTVGGYFVVALSNPFNLSLTSIIQEKLRAKVCVVLSQQSYIELALRDKTSNAAPVGFKDVVEAFGSDLEVSEESLSKEELEEESAPIVILANRVIEDAYYSGASDIHIEPDENQTRIRIRIDGVCHEKLKLPHKVATALLARLKIMSNLDIAEKRLPQDGRIPFKQYNKKGIDIDLRVATSPLNHGEGAVLRILDKQKSTLPLSSLGFSDENLGRYRELIRKPYGMILHCGPTGSGKSMTLYSALNEINSPELVIRTAEDPIEYTLPGICQMQMQKKIGITFSAALRTFLRQDPDIILVGEIRDLETAQIAVEAALTGHLLFSTLHTNDAPSTIARLTDMGIEPFMISASLICVCAQRLMRRLCKNCKESFLPEGEEARLLEEAIHWHGPIYRAAIGGCPSCGGSGYKGRIGIHELMAVSSETLIRAINAKAETVEIKKIATGEGMKTLHQDSMLKVKAGITSMEEAIATVAADEGHI
jgi:type IV pilus assembly protein PilB